MMYELMASLAQQQEPVLCEVVIVRLIHVVYIQVAHALVLHTTILAGHVPAGTNIPAEQLPSRSGPEFGAVFCISNFHIIISASRVCKFQTNK